MSPNKMIGALGLSLLAIALVAQEKAAPKSKFVLSSPDTRLAVKVPEVYTANLFGCTGGNMSPPLQWRGAPAGTKSFVVTLFDPDEQGDPSGW
jgi:Raf kinase inhibitor-like YbhB/YbcL family protein